jgi:drug/metabolite transporter (DMT)-like permease
MNELAGVVLAVLAAVGLAVQGLAVRLGTADRPVVDVLTVVFGVNVLVLLPVAAVADPPGESFTLTALAAFAVAGILGSLLGRACYFVGIARLGASRAEPLRALFPLFALGTAVVVLDETVTPGLLGGVVLLVVGGAVVASEARGSPATASGQRLWIDLSFPLMAAVLYGIDPVVTRLGLAEGTSVMTGLAVRIVAAASVFVGYLGWRAIREDYHPSVSIDRWLTVAGLANTGYLLAYFGALERAPVVVVAPVMGVSTLFVVAGAAVFLRENEQVTTRLAVGAVIVVFGVATVASA